MAAPLLVVVAFTIPPEIFIDILPLAETPEPMAAPAVKVLLLFDSALKLPPETNIL